MRFYNLVLVNPVTGLTWQVEGDGFTQKAGGTTFSSLVNGYTDPNALQIEFDFVATPFATFQAQAAIKVWGVGLGMISQASNLNNSTFQLSAGMAPGLPLANPDQSGLIATGSVFNAYGNWQGVNQTLDLICYLNGNVNISFLWKRGTLMSQAIVSALTAAFPGYKIPTPMISSNLVAPSDKGGTYDSLQGFASAIGQLSLQLGVPLYGNSYGGVQIAPTGSTIVISDNQSGSGISKKLAFQDFLGQPTWIASNQITFQTVLRADISTGDTISFPIGIGTPYALTSDAAGAYPNSAASNNLAFQGEFTIAEVHHFANFRGAQADCWNTTFVANALYTPNAPTAQINPYLASFLQ